MDIAFADNLLCPRRLVLEVSPQYPSNCYTCVSERGNGTGSHSDYSLMTRDEWLIWIERFRDELTGKEIREAIEAVKAPFNEPQCWLDMRERFKQTGDAFLK